MNTKIIKPLELIHIGLCGPSSIKSIGGNKYIHVIFYAFYQITWILFLKKKSKTTQKMIGFVKQVELQLQMPVRKIHSDNGTYSKIN